MADVSQTEERPRLVERGDRFIETTPLGGRIDLTVIEVDAEPKYPKDDERPYVRLSRDGSRGGSTFVMSERVLLDVDWIQPLPDELDGGS